MLERFMTFERSVCVICNFRQQLIRQREKAGKACHLANEDYFVYKNRCDFGC